MLARKQTNGSCDVLVISHDVTARVKSLASVVRVWECWCDVPSRRGDPMGAKPTLLFAEEDGHQLSWITLNFPARKWASQPARLDTQCSTQRNLWRFKKNTPMLCYVFLCLHTVFTVCEVVRLLTVDAVCQHGMEGLRVLTLTNGCFPKRQIIKNAIYYLKKK